MNDAFCFDLVLLNQFITSLVLFHWLSLVASKTLWLILSRISLDVVYQATIETTSDTKHYIGLTATTFKTRFTAHKSSFTDKGKRNSTELSKHIWNLKDKNTPYTMTWKILQTAAPYTPKTKRCNLCLSEKYHIITADKTNLLNSRSEIISTCRHKRKYLLINS